MKKKKVSIFLSIIMAWWIVPVMAETLTGLPPEKFPPTKQCASCHNVSNIYNELEESSHASMTCLECHVPGQAQQSKYKKADERNFFHMGYFKGHGKWTETKGNAVCLRCHDDKKNLALNKKCWECHMPVNGIDHFVIVKDKKQPPEGNNIKLIKEYSHRSHLFMFHIKKDGK